MVIMFFNTLYSYFQIVKKMKKIYLFFTAASLLFATGCSEDSTDPSNNGGGGNTPVEVSRAQKATLFNMTATWCQYCPLGKTATGNTLSKNPTKTTGIVAHVSSSDLGIPQGDTLLAMFGGTGTPTMAVGNTKVPNYTDPNVTEAKFVEGMNAILANDTRVGLKLEKSNGSGGDITIKVHGKWFNDPQEGTYKVAVFFTESGIVNRQKQPNNTYKDDEVHNNVLRKVITPLTGVDFDAAMVKKDAVVSKVFTTNMAGFPLDKMECVVVVWRQYMNNGRNTLEFINSDKISL